MKHYAIAVVVEAPDAEAAHQEVRGTLSTSLADVRDINAPTVVLAYVGDACETIPADEYETEGIHLLADGEKVVSVPPTPQSVTLRTVTADQLQSGWQVRAPGAPAWSTVQSVFPRDQGREVEIRTTWGGLIYGVDEEVQAMVPVTDAGDMSTSDGLGAQHQPDCICPKCGGRVCGHGLPLVSAEEFGRIHRGI